MIPRFLYKRSVILSVFLTLLIFVIVSNSGSQTTPINHHSASTGDSASTPKNANNLYNVIAGQENNKKLWQAIKDSTSGSDSFGGKLYDYLFTGANDNFLSSSSSSGSAGSASSHVEKLDENLKFTDFLYQLFKKVFELKPESPDLSDFYQKDADGNLIKVPTLGMDNMYKSDKPNFSINYLKSIIKLNKLDVDELKTKHSRFVDFMKNLKLPIDFYKKNSNGIIYVGGGKFTWFALLSIRNVRQTGSNLPIELFIPTKDEYEYVVCEEILPKLNAKCVLMYEFLKDHDKGKSPIFKDAEFKGFTYKSLALLLSSFENILLLDADNVPYYNPDLLFLNEPYTSSKFVVWPDYWQRSTSPYFYDIASIDLVGLNSKDHTEEEIKDKIPLHNLKGAIPNPSTESGQLMISKSKHWDVLLLSLYYNIYGPKHYYHLFSQGAAGQGDKETFLAAATVLESSFYQVTSKVSAIGYFKKEGGDYRGTAQGQKSPIEDLLKKTSLEGLKKFFKEHKDFVDNDSEINKIVRKYAEGKEELSEDEFNQLTKYNNIKEPDVFFIHESTPKLDPIQLIHDEEFINDEVVDPATNENKRIRFYGNYITKKNNYQFEKLQMDYIYDYLCDRNLIIRFIEEQIKKLYVNQNQKFDKQQFCKKLDEQRQWLAGVEFTD